MMIVVPMLIQTVTFGWIYEHLLDNDATTAILLAGILLACGGITCCGSTRPGRTRSRRLIPLGAPRHIQAVYDEVIVGSDGTPTSFVAVGHAAGVAHAAEASWSWSPRTTRARTPAAQRSRAPANCSTGRARRKLRCRRR